METINFEAQMAGWSQTHNGGCKLTLWLNEEDLDKFKLMTVKKGNCAGQRMMCVVVEIGPDEQPVQDRDKPRDPLRMSAVMIAKDATFQQFAAEYDTIDGTNFRTDEDHAAQTIRRFCQIESRRELETNPEAAKQFARLMHIYREWQEVN